MRSPRPHRLLIIGALLPALLLGACTAGETRPKSEKYQGVPQTLSKDLRSYAVHNGGSHPIKADFFGLPGAHSLNQQMEAGILSALQEAGAFKGKKAFDPVQTDAAKRQKPAKFISSPQSESQLPAQAQTSGQPAVTSGSSNDSTAATNAKPTGSITINNSVIAAGGKYVVSLLNTEQGGQKTSKVFVTDLSADTTQSANSLFAKPEAVSDQDLATLSFGPSTMPNINGKTVTEDELSALGKDLSKELNSKLELPKADTTRPDYSCELLPCVAVTFDDGPGDAKLTDELAGYLKEANVRATFFDIGTNLAHFPEQAKKLADMGNETENHSWNHPQLSRMSAAAVKSQLEKTDAAAKAAGLKVPTMLRPTYGATNRKVNKAANKRVVMWDVDTVDWQVRDKDKTTKNAMQATKPGSIVLLHAIHPSSVKASQAIFTQLKERGFYPVTVSYLFEGLPFKNNGEYFCRGYRPLCSNPEHPEVKRN